MTIKCHILEAAIRLVSCYLKNRVEGAENLPPKGEGYIAAANHRSFIDGLIMPQTLVTARKEAVHMVSYSFLYDIFVVGMVLRWAQGLVLDASSKAGIERFMADARRMLVEKHECVGLHPEAHIQTNTTRLGKGRPGAAQLSIETGCPVVPIGLIGTDVVMPAGSRKMNYKRRAISMLIGKPMYFKEYKKAYDQADQRERREILAGCTTLVMLGIAKLTRQPYPFGERSLERLKKHKEEPA